VYSEFARIDPSGEVAAPAEPREILSPALARNAFTSFQVVVQVPEETRYQLVVGQNPDDAVRVTLYREKGEMLEPVSLPYNGAGTQIFWMDVWTERTAPVRRIKVEPQLSVNADWVVYPMEARVMDATVPDGHWPEGSASAVALFRNFVCGAKLDPSPAAGLALAGLRFRNAQQDLALASHASKDGLRRLTGCFETLSDDPEQYLRVRDYLFRMR
jgi:hypothetical protein